MSKRKPPPENNSDSDHGQDREDSGDVTSDGSADPGPPRAARVDVARLPKKRRAAQGQGKKKKDTYDATAKAAGKRKRKRATARVAAESSGDESNYSSLDSDDDTNDSDGNSDDGEEVDSDSEQGESESSASISDDSGPSRKNQRLLSQKKRTRGKPGDKVRLVCTSLAVVFLGPILNHTARGGADRGANTRTHMWFVQAGKKRVPSKRNAKSAVSAL